ncbi:MAG TPA: D-glycero-beta-D-manno-heptose-7-phosphate kinase [Gemmataceae bacterium]|nr:D-glycero-beta-D-manno-heptose-7-phosphate kinase [Gemmataceae bacterium]
MMDESLKALLGAFPSRRILVAGDVMLDEYIWGNVQRISPEAPVPVVEVRRRTHVAGGAANAAMNVASLGGEALLAGVVGADEPAMRLRAALRERGVATDGLIEDRQRRTTTKTRLIAHSQQVARIDDEHRSPLAPEMEDRLLAWAERQLPRCHACVLSDYAKGVVSRRFAEGLIGLARRGGKPVVVDPKGTDYGRYRAATVIKPNAEEARKACGIHADGLDGVLEAGNRLLELLDGAAVLLTRGPEGMSLFRRGLPPLHIAPEAREVFDVTGAGDTVVGVAALALAAGAALETAARLANRAAAVVVAKVGTAQATREELLGERPA